MENERVEQDLPEEMDKISEGWWTSVMEEDSCYAIAEERKQQVTDPDDLAEEPDPTVEDVNWDLIGKMYQDETVITGTVVDFNKGGLLVIVSVLLA